MRDEELVDKEMKLEEKKVKVKVSEDSPLSISIYHQLKCILCFFHRNATQYNTRLNKYKKAERVSFASLLRCSAPRADETRLRR